MRMTLVNKRGRKRIREILTYGKDYGKDTRKLMFFLKPSDVKGTGFLAYEYRNSDREDDRWLYLPALRKVRRISGSSKNDYFMGSDFTYNDLGKVDLEKFNYTFIRTEMFQDHKCWVVESKPKKRADNQYSKKIVYVRQDALKVIKAEYYDWDKRHLKTMNVTELEKKQGFWTAGRIIMHNVQNKHKTFLELIEMKYNSEVKNSMLTVPALQRGRVR